MRTLILSTIAGALLVLPLAPLAWSKAHVPLDRIQICDANKNEAKTVRSKDLAKRLAKGDCRLTACDFGPGRIFQNGQACVPGDVMGHQITGGADGICDSVQPPLNPATTAACQHPF